MIRKILAIGIIGITLIGGMVIKKIETTDTGMLITFKDDTGYYVGK